MKGRAERRALMKPKSKACKDKLSRKSWRSRRMGKNGITEMKGKDVQRRGQLLNALENSSSKN